MRGVCLHAAAGIRLQVLPRRRRLTPDANRGRPSQSAVQYLLLRREREEDWDVPLRGAQSPTRRELHCRVRGLSLRVHPDGEAVPTLPDQTARQLHLPPPTPAPVKFAQLRSVVRCMTELHFLDFFFYLGKPRSIIFIFLAFFFGRKRPLDEATFCFRIIIISHP